MNKCLLTIIVPIYNVENYLDQCLSSLVMQTSDKFKVIMVNDGSTDRSGDIARRYATEYPNQFLYTEQENKGLGAARNTGMRMVDTPYLTFLDSDDWWMQRSVERISEAIEKTDVPPDLIFTLPKIFDMATNNYLDWRDNQFIEDMFSKFGNVLSPKIHTDLYRTEASVCRLVIKTELLKLHDFSFPEGIKWEDVFPHFAILNWSHRCVLVKGAGFVYRTNSGNQITSLSDKSRLDFVPAFAITYSYALNNNWSKYELAFIFEMMMSFLSWFLKATNADIYPVFIENVHRLAASLPNECYEAYCEIVNPEKKTKLLWSFLKSETLHKLLYSANHYEAMKKVYFKLKGRLH